MGAQIHPSSAQVANHSRTRCARRDVRHARIGKSGGERIGKRHALANGGEGEKLLALQTPVEHRHIDAMGGEPRGAAAQFGSFGRHLASLRD